MNTNQFLKFCEHNRSFVVSLNKTKGGFVLPAQTIPQLYPIPMDFEPVHNQAIEPKVISS